MAIYHLSTQPISRGQGRSVVACAAYRAGEKLKDLRYDKIHDYQNKQNVAYAKILLPENAPEWMKDREALWNHVEEIEKRKDARLAREIQFSLPRELSEEQNKALAKEFVLETFVKQGMVADLCIHLDKGKDGEEQPHCHVLLSTRYVNQQGFGMKNVEWNRKDKLLEWREAWATAANAHLAKHGHDIKIDHRSNVEQQIELEPQNKIGTAKLRLKEERLANHERIARENGERIYNKPEIILDALTKQQSTFSAHDLARFVNRHTENAEQFHKVYERVKLSEELVKLGIDREGKERFSTKEMLSIEASMLKNADVLSNKKEKKRITKDAIEEVLAKRSLSSEQEEALKYITENGDLRCVLGYAGTGKSYMLEAAREVWEKEGYSVKGVSLSGIAAQNLQQSSGIKSKTCASLLYSWDKGKNNLSDKDVLVIDEAGMLGSRQMAKIVKEAQSNGAKVVMIGDWQQLQAIEAGAAFRAIAQSNHYLELTEVRRQESSWQREATVCLAKGQVEKVLSKYKEHDHLHHAETQTEAKQRLIEQWNDVRHSMPNETQLIMAYTRADVKELNSLAREIKEKDGELGESITFEMNSGQRQFAKGDRVYFLRRDNSLGVINGTLGTIEGINADKRQIKIKLDENDLNNEQRQIVVNTEHYKHLDHGYAATVHKAQGVTVDRSYLLSSKHYDAHSSYVGMSRHKKSCDVFYSSEQFKNEQELYSTLSRNRIKDVTLDYTKPAKDYAVRREIKPDHRLESLFDLQQKFEQNAPKYEEQMKVVLEEKYKEEKQQFWDYANKFLLKFQATKPEVARRINESLVPEHEKQALAYIKQFKAYSNDPKKLRSKDREEFALLTKEIVGSKEIMNHISNKEPELAKQIKQTFKEQEHLLKHELSLDMGRGF